MGNWECQEQDGQITQEKQAKSGRERERGQKPESDIVEKERDGRTDEVISDEKIKIGDWLGMFFKGY